MKQVSWKRLTMRRSLGLVVMVLGVFVLFAPIFTGVWILALLGIALVVAGLLQFIQTLRAREETKSSYAAAVVTTLLGLVLFVSPNLVLSGLLSAVSIFLLVEGGVRVFASRKQTGPNRWWGLANGLSVIFLGMVVWNFLSASVGLVAIGVILGLRLLMEGWTMFFLPEKGFRTAESEVDTRQHPDKLLKLAPSDSIKKMQDALLQRRLLENGQNLTWCLTLLAIFFAIHLLRTDAKWNFIGVISPFSAVIGDTIVALILAIVLILPLRILWRKFTRPFERTTWRRLEQLQESKITPTLGARLLTSWLERRMRFSLDLRENRYSLNYAFWRVLRIGLPLTAVFIAVNSIWGFSWYFNSENWASGVWQQITSHRVDVWRQRMTEEVEKVMVAKGVGPEKLFAIEPEGVTNEGDFSFVVIGDTGEGDPSQMSLRDQLIAANRRDRVKFLVLSSDVIYPDGKMKDYETNFYLPFKGFEKPIYAIPGNHDWFDADEGFNANFLDRDSAIPALRARLAVDLKTEAITTDQRFTEITNEAQRLRQYYGIRNGLQRAPYFEMHTAGFSLIAVDTGILRRVDDKQKAWLESALTRAANNFKLVVLGHPFYVNGKYTADQDHDFNELHALLQRYGVDVAMAGDTHDFEFYKEKYAQPGKQSEMLHFVNGGGGAYLSVGTALGFPDNPAVPDYAFYPRTDELTTKIRNEIPFWKSPFLLWMQWLHGYPFDSEMVSGAFDFNRAPFFQSFVEVNVERSQHRVRIQLYGVNGPLRWRDVQVGGQVKPPDKSDDDFVEFIAPLH